MTENSNLEIVKRFLNNYSKEDKFMQLVLERLAAIIKGGNQIFQIQLRQKPSGSWVVDDLTVGMKDEPLVAGIPEIIENFKATNKIKGKNFSLRFSSENFEGQHLVLDKIGEQSTGCVYSYSNALLEGWICKCLYYYYTVAPEKLYVQLEAV